MENVRALYVLLLFAAFVIPMILFFCVCVYCGLATKSRKINQQNRILYAIGREDYFQYKPAEMNLSINLKDSQSRRTSQCTHDKKKSKSHRHSSISHECMKTKQSHSHSQKHHHHKHEHEHEKQQNDSPQQAPTNVSDCPPV